MKHIIIGKGGDVSEAGATLLESPKRQVSFQFNDFDLKDLSTINLRPIDDGLIIQIGSATLEGLIARFTQG